MKYLKTYNEKFTSLEEIHSDLKDIFQELEDDGFNIVIKNNLITLHQRKEITNNYYEYNSFIIDKQITDCVLRLIDYLRINKYLVQKIGVKVHGFDSLPENICDVDENGFYLSINKSFKVDFKIFAILIYFGKNN